MLPGANYTIGNTTHTFPYVQMDVAYDYKQSQEKLHLALLTLLEDFDKEAEIKRLSYTIGKGTLLGAVRHGGFIPWEAKVCVDMLAEHALLLEESLPSFSVAKSKNYTYKVTRKGTSSPSLTVHLVDFVSHRLQHLSSSTSPITYSNAYNDIYPRRRYSFENISVWGPKEGRLLCNRLYGGECMQKAVIKKEGLLSKVLGVVFRG